MSTYDKHAEDGYPSKNPPVTSVTAGPYQEKEYLKWYNGSKTEIIESQDIIQSTIEPKYNLNPHMPKIQNLKMEE